MSQRFFDRLERGVKQLSFWEFHTGLALLLVAGVANCLWLLLSSPPLYHVSHDTTLNDGSRAVVEFSTEWMLIRIGAALVAAGVLLLRRSGTGLLLSVVCLLWVLGEHLRWYLMSLSLGIEVHVFDAQSQAEAGNALFYGATNWSVAVLSVTTVLLIWELMLTWKALRKAEG